MSMTPERIQKICKNATQLYSKIEVDAALDRMAQEMKLRLSDSDPIFLCILLGGVVPLGNLLPRLDFHLEINYVHVSSYYGGTSGKELIWRAKPTVDLKGRNVVIVDDILDTGVTLKIVSDFCKEQGAKEVLTAVLLDKKKPRKPGGVATADFKALTIDNHFVFGYGLDYDEYLRNAPGIFAVAPEDQ